MVPLGAHSSTWLCELHKPPDMRRSYLQEFLDIRKLPFHKKKWENISLFIIKVYRSWINDCIYIVRTIARLQGVNKKKVFFAINWINWNNQFHLTYLFQFNLLSHTLNTTHTIHNILYVSLSTVTWVELKINTYFNIDTSI